MANKSRVPIKQKVSVTCFSSIETQSRYFMIPFAVADTKYKLLGKPFFEKTNQKISIQDYIMSFKHSCNEQPTLALFTTLFEINFHSFSFNNKKNL